MDEEIGVYVDFNKCPRCDGKHEKLEIKTLKNPIVDPAPVCPDMPCQYHEWSTCPITGEPILYRKPEKDDLKIPIPIRDEEEIRDLAYHIWLTEGKPDGKDKEHWALAREALTRYFTIASQLKFRITHYDLASKECTQRSMELISKKMMIRMDKLILDSLNPMVTLSEIEDTEDIPLVHSSFEEPKK